MFTFALVSAAVLFTLIAPAACLKLMLGRAWNPVASQRLARGGVVEGIPAAPISQYG
jgi:hypothetical protein